ncbi:hypothetical protein PtA15_1A698 [Puccinia triticina]|uniref:Uncharacterized protein n=1 Tax=Puccinia triticina TaxID=208348 RepID=A0ABY7CAE2_9BASI|nr:uncharacterized protein PtA15_1A698 [Puccinia triticina]WAQ81358.1 hypothetical protein PtA15_1A698 [Puccinia triticina]WAR52239.1 hypothetical protein PtB15_1B680 [Puccinia triticina]
MNSPMPADQPAPPRPSSLADQPASSSSPPEPASAAEQYARLRGVAIGLLDQALELLRTAVDSDALLTAVSELVPGSTRNVPMESATVLAEFDRLKQILTTFNRELWFACLHATHHYALIRVIVTGELRRQLPKEFGVAPSTLERSKM